jgi:hypothetical protein
MADKVRNEGKFLPLFTDHSPSFRTLSAMLIHRQNSYAPRRETQSREPGNKVKKINKIK